MNKTNVQYVGIAGGALIGWGLAKKFNRWGTAGLVGAIAVGSISGYYISGYVYGYLVSKKPVAEVTA
jgi:hypothetical protein